MSYLRQGLVLSVLIITINLFGSGTNAQNRVRLPQTIDDASYVRIENTRTLAATPANEAGRVEPN